MYNIRNFLAVCAADTPDPITGTADGAGGTFRDAAGSLMVGVVLFLLGIYVIYILYKYLLSKRSVSGLGFSRGKRMRVMEITPVGPGSTIQLVKVSGEYFLIGVTKNQITFLTKTGYDPIPDEIADEGKEPVFERYLSRIFKRNKQDEPASLESQDGVGDEGSKDEI
ncbi:MAG: flagellar biosynthetic protein FliO [Clostridiales bacterium]|jgi:flagellar biogenesis protein FliO|nr:flagellar biosynthetic protein FliO [Clostridiales bacterium]